MSKLACPFVSRSGGRSKSASVFNEGISVPKEAWAIDRDMAFQPEVHVSAHQAGKAMKAMNLEPYLSRITAPTLTI